MRRPALRALGLLSLGALAALAACSPPEPPHDVAYYQGHPDARAVEMAACQNDRGKAKASSNCINALAADGAAASKKFWTVPATPSRVQDPGKL
jgi:hypothetical protein